jgi:phosphoadenosine phosphosulfate reductase
MPEAVAELIDERSSDSELEGEISQTADLLEGALPQEVLAWSFERFGYRVALGTGFGADGMVLIDMAVKINPDLRIFFIDTGFLFPETYDLRRQVEERYGIVIREVRSGLTSEQQEEMYGPNLWARNPDLCCHLRKVEPLKTVHNGLDAWITAIRREQTPARARARVVEWDSRSRLVKVNPLVGWTKREVWKYILKNQVLYNPLHDRGYPSIGCTHCTRPVTAGEEDRAGRWPGHTKTECGLHAPTLPVAIASQSRA